MADPETDAGVEDVEFSRAASQALYGTEIAEQRWLRANTEVRFEDVVQELTGKYGRAISCPFHGIDSTPSFYIYSGKNNGFCFGCPPHEGFFDNTRFVAKFLNFSRTKALKWIERKWNLPVIDDVIIDEEEEYETEITTKLEFADLSEHYLKFAAADIQDAQEPELAEQYLRIYYEAEKDKLALPLGRVLGPEKVRKILLRKANR